MKILSIEQVNDTVNVTISMKSQIFTISTSIEKAKNNSNYLVNWIEKYKLFSKITKKQRQIFLNELQKNPIFSIISINPYTNKEYRIK